MGLRSFESSIVCLKSLIDSLSPTKLIIHLDGSVNDQAKEKIVLELKSKVEFVSKKYADELVGNLLKNRPVCRNFRDTNVLGAKIFDIIAINPDSSLIYFDSDIYFNQLVNISDLVESKSLVFMEDKKSSYSLRPWDYSLFKKNSVPRRVNTGMIIAKNFLLDLDFIEWLLGVLLNNAISHKRPYWLEQTVWAFLAGRVGEVRLVGEPFIGFPTAGSTRKCLSKYSAVHFVSTYRDQLKLMEPFGFASDETARWHSKPGSPLLAWNILFDDLKNRFKW